MNFLKWSIDANKLKGLGYEFNKLFANNYKVYSKEIEGYKFWLWVLEKRLEINDWHHCTLSIIEFYKQNRNIIDPIHGDKTLRIQYHYNGNATVQMYDWDEEYKVHDAYRNAKNEEEKNHCWDAWNEKYSEWSSAYLRKEAMDIVLQEIEAVGGLS